MITLSSFLPEHFNQNGDQGNLDVIQMQLKWRGIESERSTSNFRETDFLLVGDASRAAMSHFEPELASLIPVLSERLERGLPTLLVGSSHEYFCGRVEGLPALTQAKRVSEFRVAVVSGVQAFGYRNSEVQEDLWVSGSFISTTLFGPVLAKSPRLLSLVLETLGVTSELEAEISGRIEYLVSEVQRKIIAG